MRVVSMASAKDDNLVARPAKHLTKREREVLELLVEGCTMREAARVLQITPRTVAFHKYNRMHAFDLKSNADLIRFAIREGIIEAA